MTLCPCASGQAYADCCARPHGGEAAATALALMRSRYCAYVLGAGRLSAGYLAPVDAAAGAASGR
ncbi:SEC-C metal-binding domain-containing protein [Azonexus sp.]|uniref:SEC-C metal-binding domain-containing protein n=1 Tax=Azonexus sp. TaxID=1872668 RepID=UPI00283AAD39|nr:SEC-C metal-binding domain-containing protein [Azonexus sp.]